MNEFDQFMKHKIKAKYYIRYADDFVILSHNRDWLCSIVPTIKNFLWHRLKLQLHPNKISTSVIASGADYLGWISFPDHRVLRPATRNRMFREILRKHEKPETVQSYLGLISHGNSNGLKKQIRSLL